MYGAAAATVAGATVARWLLDPMLGDRFPFITYFLAVVIAAWFAGFRPAVAATLLGLLLSWYVFIPTRNSWTVDRPSDVVGLGVFVVVGLAISGFSGALHDARRRSAAAERETAEHAERLRTTLASIGDAVITTDADGRVTNPERRGRGAHRLVARRGRRPAAGRRVPHRQRGHPRRRSRTPPCGRCDEGVDRRAGQPHHPDRQGRHGAADRRQRRPDPLQGRRDRRQRAGVPRRRPSGGDRSRTRPVACSPPATWRPSSSPPTTPSSARSLDGVIQSWNAGAERHLRLHRRRGRRPAYFAAHSARTARRGRADHRPAPARRAGRALRHGAGAQGRPTGRRLADHLAGPRRRRARSSARRRSPATSPSDASWRTSCGSWPPTCPKPTAARTSSSRRWPTSSATRWPRSATPCRSSGWRTTPRRRRAGPRHDGAAGRPDGAAGRRPARRQPHHAAASSSCARSGVRAGRRWSTAPSRRAGRSSSRCGHELDGDAAAGAGPRRRRPDPAGPGVRQPAEQRAKYTERGGRIWLDRRAAGRRRGRVGPGHRHRHRRRPCCRASSTCSRRSTGRWSGRRAGWASA